MESKKQYAVPAAIIIAGLFISGAIIGSSKWYLSRAALANLNAENQPSLSKMADVSSSDHVYGSEKAPLTLVIYSDTECPYCKTFHQTVTKLLKEYGDTNKVRFVYRYFPLVNIHPKAVKEAVATECAGTIGGNEMFWNYLNRLFVITPSNNNLDLTKLDEIAAYFGIDKTKFTACTSDAKTLAVVQKNYENALATGGEGTPWSILIAKDKTRMPINGALPYDQMKKILDEYLVK